MLIKRSKMAQRGLPLCHSFPLQEQDIGSEDHQCRGVKRRALEDPVKNGACLTNVAHRRWAKGGVRRLGSGEVRSSLGTLRLQILCPAVFNKR